MKRERVIGTGYKGRNLTPLESDEQKSLFQWCDAFERTYPALKNLFSIANEAGRLKNYRYTGVRRGVPDVYLAWPMHRDPNQDAPGGDFCGLFLELKRRKGGKIAPEQYEWLSKLSVAGYAVKVCYGWEEAKDTLIAYLEGKEIA